MTCQGRRVLFDSRDVAASVAQECVEHRFSFINTKIHKLLSCVCGVLLAWKDEPGKTSVSVTSRRTPGHTGLSFPGCSD